MKLQTDIRRVDEQLDGVLAVAVKDLTSGEEFLIRGDEVMPQASSIKIAVLANLYMQAQHGRLKLTDEYVVRNEDLVPGSDILLGLTPGVTLGTQRPCLPKQDGRDKPGDGGCLPAHSGAPIEVTPLGLPTTVTSMPPPYSRLATRLASSMVTASIRAPRRCM